MKIGFIKKMGSDSKAIVTMYNGDNATFNNKDFQYKFFKSDIIIFNLVSEEPENRAIDIKKVKDCTEELIANKFKFNESEWYLVIKGNKDIFLDYVQNEIKKSKIKKLFYIRKKAYDLTPIILELISSYKIAITEWHYYKAGDDSSCGVVMHNHFNTEINSNLDKRILNLDKDWDNYYQPIKIYLNGYLSDNLSQDSFKINNQHIGKIHFLSEYLNNFFPSVSKSLYYDPSYRFINEYYKSDLKNWKKIHKDAENLEKKMQIKLQAEYSPITLFKELIVKFGYNNPQDEEYNNVRFEQIINSFIVEWDYINTFKNKKYCHSPEVSFRWSKYE